MEQIRKSMRLHGTRHAILMVHSDCGAYGGLTTRFNDSRDAEVACLQQELTLAAAYLRAHLPELRVSTYYVDFEGVWETVDAPAEAAAQ
jgi:carbonic anhydrase